LGWGFGVGLALVLVLLAGRAAAEGGTAPRGHPEEIASYTLRVSLDPAAHSIHGEGTIHFRNASLVSQRELYLHLYLNAFKNERTVFLRTPIGGFRGNGMPADWGSITVQHLLLHETGADLWPGADKTSPGDPDDETDLRVPLPTPLAPGAALDLDVAWDAHLPAVVLRTGYFGAFHMVAQWFPKLARLEPDGRWAHFTFNHLSEFYADFGRYDVTIDTPDGVIIGATGRLEHESHAGGRAERRFVQEDVHDFAFTAWDGFREKTATHEGVALRCLYPPGFELDADTELDAVRFGLTYFGAAYGPYPYGTLTIVLPPEGADEAGGMEYPTLITTGGSALLRRLGVRFADLVTIHELGHEWFYGLVATDEHTWPFLDEGLNSYAEMDAMEVRFPGSSAASLLGLSVSEPAVYRIRANDAVESGPVAQPAGAFASGADYGAIVYARTATILWTLGRVYGEDRVRGALGLYTRRYRFQHPGPAELLSTFAEALGPDAAETLHAALFDRGWVDYAVEDLISEPEAKPAGIFGDTAHPSHPSPPSPAADAPAGYRGSVLVRRRGSLRFPVDVDLTAEDGSVQRVRWEARESFLRLPYAGASPLASAVVDPEHRVMLDQNLANNAVRAAPATVAPRFFERTFSLVEAALSLLLP
jgi:hypothetical protein